MCPAAIVEAFNPAFGAPMLALTLFGGANRWGKLPVTYYSGQLPWNLTDMAISTGNVVVAISFMVASAF